MVVTPVVEQDGTITAGHVDVQFWAEEAQVLKTPEWYEAAVTAAGLSVEVARLAGDQCLEAALLARLGDLHQAQDQPADALACWQASVTLARRMGDKELEAVVSTQLAKANNRQGLFERLMETIKIRVEGFAFEEFASLFAQLLKDARVSIQVNSSSERYGALAYDPATIIVQGPEIFAAVLNALATSSIYFDEESKKETREAATSKPTPGHTCTIVLRGTGGWRRSWKFQEGVFQKEEIERLAALARENGVDSVTVYAHLTSFDHRKEASHVSTSHPSWVD